VCTQHLTAEFHPVFASVEDMKILVSEHEHDSLKVNVWRALMKKLSILFIFEVHTLTGDTFMAMMENNFPVRWCTTSLLP
jgi:hypothetical protein